jgi:excinuclease ABC subunit C
MTKNGKINNLRLKLDNLPKNPGIYQFKDKNGKIIYLGKAKNLRNRVRSYFVSKPVGPRLERMIFLSVTLSDQHRFKVESLYEMNITAWPRYNVNLKDKSFPTSS